jgi:hypothetical protein
MKRGHVSREDLLKLIEKLELNGQQRRVYEARMEYLLGEVCSVCGRSKPAHARDPKGNPICNGCYRADLRRREA